MERRWPAGVLLLEPERHFRRAFSGRRWLRRRQTGVSGPRHADAERPGPGWPDPGKRRIPPYQPDRSRDALAATAVAGRGRVLAWHDFTRWPVACVRIPRSRRHGGGFRAAVSGGGRKTAEDFRCGRPLSAVGPGGRQCPVLRAVRW